MPEVKPCHYMYSVKCCGCGISGPERREKAEASAEAPADVEAVEAADVPSETEGVDFDAVAEEAAGEAPADDAPAEEALTEEADDAPGCASCAHQDSGDDDSCDGCGDGLLKYTPLSPAMAQTLGATIEGSL